MDIRDRNRRLLDLERALTGVPCFEGWVIGKCSFKLSEETPDGPRFGKNCVILKSSSMIVELLANVFYGREWDRLRVILMNPEGAGGQKARAAGNTETEDRDRRREGSCLLIGQEETDEFLRETCDRNPIHSGPGAIVPGLLMANRILSDEGMPQAPFEAEFRFLSPLAVGREAFLQVNEGKDDSGKTSDPDGKTGNGGRVDFFLTTGETVILKGHVGAP